MEHATPTTHPPPLPLSSPPLTAAQIAILTESPPPFPGPSRSVDLSPLQFLLSLFAIITMPALIYTFLSAFCFPFYCRRQEENSGDDTINGDAASISDFRYRMEPHVKEIGDECPVCLSAFTDDEKLRKLSCCKHCFHADCINLWLRNHSSCPICRALVSGKRRSSSAAPARDHDLIQGLPDASALV
ncbi:RING-H2 finger protein ATL33 [Cicer arietinum]|uniref:RING-H2 finger protein ATL33 n=1 Tax=Cicer arietinum TaxID=3827 RepID=A0A1S2YLS8_CICAR|nr:RING-H2 finger protein ATL33 [Cicer arietinum]